MKLRVAVAMVETLVLLDGCSVDLTNKMRCRGPADCLDGFGCNDGRCTPQLPDGRFRCDASQPCSPTQLCFAGVCAAACSSGACPQGSRCVGAAGSTRLCSRGAPGDACRVVEDCQPGLRCWLEQDLLGACAVDDQGATRVVSLLLVDAATKKTIATLSPGQVNKVGNLQGREVDLRAVTSPDRVGSVAFGNSAVPHLFDDSAPPYHFTEAVGKPTVPAWPALPGPHTIRATPWTSMNGSGRSGTPLEVTLEVGTLPCDGGGCLIEGVCRQPGDADPGDACRICDPEVSVVSWGPAPKCVVTIAGDGIARFADGAGLAAGFGSPEGILRDAAGRVYLADREYYRLRLVWRGQVSTVAGDGNGGFVDGLASSARLWSAGFFALDRTGALYFTDPAGHRVRQLWLGEVTTLAGTGLAGHRDGPAGEAQLNVPMGLALDADGALLVSDSENHRIRRLQDGVLTTLAGTGVGGFADGPVASARFKNPQDLLRHSDGRLLVADSENHRVRIIRDGEVSTLAGGANGFKDDVLGLAQFSSPQGLALDRIGRIVVADTNNHRIRIIDGGRVRTIAGNDSHVLQDGPLLSASFYYPTGVQVDAVGRIWVADTRNNVLRVIRP